MRAKRVSGSLLVGALLVAGCGAPSDEGQTEDHWTESTPHRQGAEEIGLLALVNDYDQATQQVLDEDCAIRSDAARNIIAHRDGADQSPQTADDDRFDTIEELEGVLRVGERTLELLLACAEGRGYRPSEEDLVLVNFLNDQGNTTLVRLDEDCGLYSDAAQNLVGHRDGPDGIAGTADDDYFHSRAEVDQVDQVGPATLDGLQACAETFGYATGEVEWRPIPVVATVLAWHPSIVVTQSDGVIYLDGRAAPEGAQVNLGYHGYLLTITRGPQGMHTSGLDRAAPEGYGMEDLGMQADGVSRIRITKDPVGTLTQEQALTVAKLGLIEYLQDVRMHMQDWHDQMPSIDTWEAALARGVMDGIWGYCDRDYEGGCGYARTPAEYRFWGRGPFRLYTVVHVSKETEKGSYFNVQID